MGGSKLDLSFWRVDHIIRDSFIEFKYENYIKRVEFLSNGFLTIYSFPKKIEKLHITNYLSMSNMEILEKSLENQKRYTISDENTSVIITSQRESTISLKEEPVESFKLDINSKKSAVKYELGVN